MTNKVITHLRTNVIVYPEVSDKKVYPVRWLMVLMATSSALVLCFLVLLWRDKP